MFVCCPRLIFHQEYTERHRAKCCGIWGGWEEVLGVDFQLPGSSPGQNVTNFCVPRSLDSLDIDL